MINGGMEQEAGSGASRELGNIVIALTKICSKDAQNCLSCSFELGDAL